MALAQPPIYQEVYFFLASQPTHEEILAFRPSEAMQNRIQALLTANKKGQLTAELDEYEQLEHFVRMLKLHTIILVEKF
jgi:hypothetical protein